MDGLHPPPGDDPVLARVRSAVADLYGPRLRRLVLYGSRARGDARPDSDYDVAVFLAPLGDRLAEAYRLADLGVEIFDATGALVHARPYDAAAHGDPASPLMHEIRREGRDL